MEDQIEELIKNNDPLRLLGALLLGSCVGGDNENLKKLFDAADLVMTAQEDEDQYIFWGLAGEPHFEVGV